MLKALLVDDEINNLASLEFLLHHDCEGVLVTGKADSAAQARRWLQANQIDVLFLDIDMPGENGFEFLNSIKNPEFKVVFVTAYNQFALQAIKASAVDYILKPVSIDELQKAVEKVKRAIGSATAGMQDRCFYSICLTPSAKNLHPKK
jgi:two-component system LytT family response regulator